MKKAVDALDLRDAIESEAERLEALADLLLLIREELRASAARGLGTLLRDVARRLRAL